MDYSVPSSRRGMGLLPHPSRRAGHRLALLTLLGVGLLMFIGQSMAAGGGGGENDMHLEIHIKAGLESQALLVGGLIRWPCMR